MDATFLPSCLSLYLPSTRSTLLLRKYALDLCQSLDAHWYAKQVSICWTAFLLSQSMCSTPNASIKHHCVHINNNAHCIWTMRCNDGWHTLALSQHLNFRIESTDMLDSVFAMIVEIYRWKLEKSSVRIHISYFCFGCCWQCFPGAKYFDVF